MLIARGRKERVDSRSTQQGCSHQRGVQTRQESGDDEDARSGRRGDSSRAGSAIYLEGTAGGDHGDREWMEMGVMKKEVRFRRGSGKQ